MGPMQLFGKTVTMLEQAMDLRSRHHNRVVSNIVNIDTPGYRPFDVAVDEALARLDRSEGEGGLQRTHPAHLGTGVCAADSHAAVGRSADRSASGVIRTDGNSVSLEQSMAELSENQITYNALSQIVGRKFRVLREAIRGGS